MNWLQKLPQQRRSASGLEWRLWRQLPALTMWGTLLALAVAAVLHIGAALNPDGWSDKALLLWDYRLAGAVILHWTLVFTVAVGCGIVIVMKGPAYVADAYPLAGADDDQASGTKTHNSR